MTHIDERAATKELQACHKEAGSREKRGGGERGGTKTVFNIALSGAVIKRWFLGAQQRNCFVAAATELWLEGQSGHF